MKAYDIAFIYSKALYRLLPSKEERLMGQTFLELLVDIFKRQPEVASYFLSPHIAQAQKEKVLEESLGNRIPPSIKDYFSFLLRKGHFDQLAEIAKAYRKLIEEESEMMEGTLITTQPLDPSTKEKLLSKLEKTYSKKINITEKIDPKLIGGGIFLIGNRLIDFSVKGKLDQLKKELLSIQI